MSNLRPLARVAAAAIALALVAAGASAQTPAARRTPQAQADGAYLEAGDALGFMVFAPELRGEGEPRAAAKRRPQQEERGRVAAERSAAQPPASPAKD